MRWEQDSKFNINSNLDIKSRSILGSKSSISVKWAAGVGTIFGVKGRIEYYLLINLKPPILQKD